MRSPRLLTIYLWSVVTLFIWPIIFTSINPHLAAIRNWQIALNLVLIIYLWINKDRDIFSQFSTSEKIDIFPFLATTSLISFIVCTLFHYYAFRVNGIDFSTFDLMLYNFNHHNMLYSPMCDCNHFGVHTMYSLLALAPLHKLINSPLFLIILHAVLLWAPIFSLQKIAYKYLGDKFLSHLIVISYLTSSWTGTILNHAFHPEVLFIWGGLVLVEGLIFNRLKLITIGLIIFLSVREDAPLYCLGFASAIFLFEKSRRKLAISIILISITMFMINIFLIQPKFLDSSTTSPQYLSFWGQYGKSLKDVAAGMLVNLDLVGKDIVSSSWYILWGSFLFIPLLSGRSFVASVPALVILGTSSNPHMRSYNTYYAAIILPFFLWGVCEGCAKFLRQKHYSHHIKYLLVASILLVSPLIGGDYMNFPQPQFGVAQQLQKIEDEILTPEVNRSSTKKVCAQSILFPHLSYQLAPKPFEPSCLDDHQMSSIVLLNEKLSPYPFTKEEISLWATTLKNNEKVIKKDNFLILIP